MKNGFKNWLIFFAVITVISVAINIYISSTGKDPNKLNEGKGVNVRELGVIPDDGVDRTELFQTILDNHRIVWVPKGVYTISSGKYRNGNGNEWWGLKIPSNTTIHFEKGAILRFKDNMPTWSRALVIYKAKNVRITGHLEIDGNCDSVIKGNEHMANLFIESSKNVYIQSIYSHDSFGDNLFLGGTEFLPSENIKIDNVKGVRAGRKNFVIHYVNNLHVKRAILDNTRGDSARGWTGANSIDLEPDNYTGTKRFYQRFDYVSTNGKGNDFTVGTSKKNAENWVLDIGTLDVHRMAGTDSSSAVLLSYALTAKINRLNIFVPKGEEAVPIKLRYAAKWNVNELSINGGNKYGISMQYADNEKPSLEVKKLEIRDVTGYGIRNEGGDISLGTFSSHNISGRVFHNYSTSPDNKVDVNRLEVYDSGTSEVLKVSSYLNNRVHMSIGSLKIIDKRATKAERLIYFETGEAVKGFTIGKIDNPNNIKEFSYASGLTRQLKRTK